jgi:hypothetical protein
VNEIHATTFRVLRVEVCGKGESERVLMASEVRSDLRASRVEKFLNYSTSENFFLENLTRVNVFLKFFWMKEQKKETENEQRVRQRKKPLKKRNGVIASLAFLFFSLLDLYCGRILA